MAFLIDPPSRMGKSIPEQIQDLRDFCDHLTEQLNDTLNNLSTKNMDSETANAIGASANALLNTLQRRVSALQGRSGAAQSWPVGSVYTGSNPTGSLPGTWSDMGTLASSTTHAWVRTE